MMPNRHATAPDWWEIPGRQIAAYPMDGNTFRRAFFGARYALPLGPGDARLTPAGDVARRGNIPPYTTFAVLNPGNLTTTVQ